MEYTSLVYYVFMKARQNFVKKESRSPRGFLLRPLLRAGESVAPPPLPQKNSGGAHHFRFRFLDLCIRFGKIIPKVFEGFNSGANENPHLLGFLFAPVVGFEGSSRTGISAEPKILASLRKPAGFCLRQKRQAGSRF